MNLFSVWIASFIFIFFKAFQQRNVAFDHYKWIIPTSVLMAASELIVIGNIAVAVVGEQPLGYMVLMALVIGTGSGSGALIAAIIHKRYLGNGSGKRQ